MDEPRNFADVRLAWNELGLGVQVEVRGKEQLPQGDAARPRGSDGVTLWIDTRDARTSHRASRYCHQFHFLPTGGGPERDEPAFVQTKINRALQDAPLCPPDDGAVSLPTSTKGGYRLEAFLPAAVLNGFDPGAEPAPGLLLRRPRRRTGRAGPVRRARIFPTGKTRACGACWNWCRRQPGRLPLLRFVASAGAWRSGPR